MSSPPTMMGSTSASDERVADDAFKAKPSKTESDKAKNENRFDWIVSSSLDDVVFNETEWVQLGRDANQKTRLQGIKGYAAQQLTVPALKKFCAQHKIGGWKDKQKHVLCELIVNAVKSSTLEAAVYPDGDAMAAASNDITSEKKACKKKKKKKSKKSKPEAVRQEGTLYRVINTLFLQDIRHLVVRLGHQPTARALDKRELLHQDIFEALVKIYNDKSREDILKLPHPHDFFSKTKVADDIASNFDPLTPLEFSEIFDFINYHYKVALRNSTKSGKHAPFQNYVRTQPYLYAYYLCLLESPLEQQNLAFAQLPSNVKRESTTSANKSNRDSSNMPRKPQKHTARQQASAAQASALQDISNVSTCDCLAILFVVVVP
jgi:hypothetical protein